MKWNFDSFHFQGGCSCLANTIKFGLCSSNVFRVKSDMFIRLFRLLAIILLWLPCIRTTVNAYSKYWWCCRFQCTLIWNSMLRDIQAWNWIYSMKLNRSPICRALCVAHLHSLVCVSHSHNSSKFFVCFYRFSCKKLEWKTGKWPSQPTHGLLCVLRAFQKPSHKNAPSSFGNLRYPHTVSCLMFRSLRKNKCAWMLNCSQCAMLI